MDLTGYRHRPTTEPRTVGVVLDMGQPPCVGLTLTRVAGASSRGCLGSLLERCDNNGVSGALDDRLQLFLLWLGHLELLQRLLNVIHKGLPLLGRNHEMPMAIAHGTTGVFLRAACGLTNHFGHKDVVLSGEPVNRRCVITLQDYTSKSVEAIRGHSIGGLRARKTP
jgi:hypothetical protein